MKSVGRSNGSADEVGVRNGPNHTDGAPRITLRIGSSDDKSQMMMELSSQNGSINVQRSYSELEHLYGLLKSLLPASVEKPPKRRFLVAETKLAEKRKSWAEMFVSYLLSKEDNLDKSVGSRGRVSPTNALWFSPLVHDFLGPLLSASSREENSDFIDLGPSEKKSVKPSHFDFLKTIGQGSFGRVYLVRYHTDQKVYAMKVLGKEHIKMRNEVKHVMAERNVLLSNINHPFLVSLHYSFQTKDKLYFVLDFLNGGELFFHLQRERCFSESRARFYAAEVASALGYLHEVLDGLKLDLARRRTWAICASSQYPYMSFQKDIIYRDLKPENMLLDRFGHVVLTDFGLCKEGIKMCDTTNTFCGTPEYLAPEVIQKKPYDRTVDWWCLGSVLHENCDMRTAFRRHRDAFIQVPFSMRCSSDCLPSTAKTRYMPWAQTVVGDNGEVDESLPIQHEMYEKTLNQPLIIPSTASSLAKDLLTAMLKKSRHERMGAKRDFGEVREHPFFVTIDWERLVRRELRPPFVPKVRCETDTVNISREFVEIEPNAASLAPTGATYCSPENEFPGFTFVQKPMMMGGGREQGREGGK